MGGFPAGVRLAGGAGLTEDVRDASDGPPVSVGGGFGPDELGEAGHDPASLSACASARASGVSYLGCVPPAR